MFCTASAPTDSKLLRDCLFDNFPEQAHHFQRYDRSNRGGANELCSMKNKLISHLTGRAGMVKLMDNDEVMGPINIGNPTEFTMLELAKV